MSISGKSKAGSLKWAIKELSKQREDLDAKLKIANKRDETNSLIEEVFAQKKALEQRISALEDGLLASSELVDAPSSELESEMDKIDEKLDIAKERLQAIEQEEYLEELGKSLNRSHVESSPPTSEMDIFSKDTQSSVIDDLQITDKSSSSIPSKSSSQDKSVALASSSSPIITPVMKPTTNRIQEQPNETEQVVALEETSSIPQNPQTVLSLEETANKLGVKPDFLAEQCVNAFLRMIARNGHKLSFPLEVEQIK